MDETVVISLGGSLIIPDQIDVEFLKSFKELIFSYIKKGQKFVIVTGGGKLCRRYQDATKEISGSSNNELDWMGIYSTRFNAEFLRLILGEEYTESAIIIDPTLPINFTKQIILGGGWKPGWSTDYVSVMLGKLFGAKKVINLSNTDYVYDSDPKKNPEAKKN